MKTNGDQDKQLKYKVSGTLYFWSGTGNSYRAAIWMKDEIRNEYADTRVVPVGQADPEKEIGHGAGHLMGIVFPTHGFTAPWPVIRFVLGLPRRNGTNAVIVVTRAGTKVGPVCFPGMEGTAGYLIALFCMLKGYSVQGVTGLDMPSNWIAFHWGISEKNSRIIIDRARISLSRFIRRIIEVKRCFRGFICLFLGLLLLPVSAGYLILGRFYLAKLFFADNRCTGCGLCSLNCPSGAIQMRGGEKLRPYWTFSCESCMRCMAYCPERAIEAGHSFAVILWYVTVIPVSVYIMSALRENFPWISIADNPVTRFLIDYMYIILSIYVLYLLFSLVLQIPFINTLFTYTTLTRFYRRYHEPDTNTVDLKRASETKQ